MALNCIFKQIGIYRLLTDIFHIYQPKTFIINSCLAAVILILSKTQLLIEFSRVDFMGNLSCLSVSITKLALIKHYFVQIVHKYTKDINGKLFKNTLLQKLSGFSSLIGLWSNLMMKKQLDKFWRK